MSKENKVYVVAIIASKGKSVGARITDLADRSRKCKDVSLSDLFTVYKNKPFMFKNITIENNKLSSMGSSFTVVDFDTKKPISDKFIVVANRLGNLGYTLLDYLGNVKKCNIEDTMKLATTSKFANATVGQGILQPKTVDFITEELNIQKDSAIESIGAGLMMDASKKMVGSYRADALNAISKESIFDGLSDKQIQAIQTYYLWYTVEEYNKLSHNMTFKIKENKDNKLSNIRQDYVWYFGGIVDRGFKGNSKCTLGHPIRYEYISLGYESIKEHDTNPKNYKSRVKFGETCSSDFFLIPLSEMRKLVKIRKAMSEEIELIANAKKKQVYENNSVEWDMLWDNVSFIKSLIANKNLMQLTKAFGGKIANTLIMFRDLDIPFPDSLVNLACETAFGSSDKMSTPNKTYDFWKVILGKEYKHIIEWIYSFNGYRLFDDLKSYLDFMCCYGLAGDYKYDPLKKTGKRYGPLNKATRAARYNLISSYFKFRIRSFSYDELMQLLDSLQLIKEIYELLNPDIIRQSNMIVKLSMGDTLEISKVANCILGVNAFNLKRGDYYRNELRGVYLRTPSDTINILKDTLDMIKDDSLLEILTKSYYYIKGLKELSIHLSSIERKLNLLYSNNKVLVVNSDNTVTFDGITVDTTRLEDKEYTGFFELLGSLDIVKTIKGTDIATNNTDNTQSKDDKLHIAFNLVSKDSSRYEDKIVVDMYNRGLSYSKLSQKQSYIVDKVIEHYKNGTNNDGLTQEEKDNIDKILELAKTNREFVGQLKNISSITYNVLLSIKEKNSMTRRQERHYLEAMERLNEFEKEQANNSNISNK